MNNLITISRDWKKTMSDKPRKRDQIDVLMTEGDSMEYKDLIEKLEELNGLNAHKVYDSFHATMVKDPQNGWALLFEGDREEDNAETAKREAEETAKKKRVRDAELKEYLRLKKIYGKKE